MKITEKRDVGYFEINAVFNEKPLAFVAEV